MRKTCLEKAKGPRRAPNHVTANLVGLGQAAVTGPLNVEGTWFVGALEGVGAEEISLALDESGRQALGTQAVVVGEGRRKDRCRKSQLGSGDDHAAPRVDEVFQLALEVGVENEGGQVRICLLYTSDAADE
mgnify:FL=1